MSVEASSAEAWWDRVKDSRTPIPMSHWGHRFGVIPELVPFGHRSFDPFEIVLSARERIDRMPPTAASVSAGQLLSEADVGTHAPNGLEVIFTLIGCWRSDRVERKSRWINPNYIHTTALDETYDWDRERIEHLRLCASVGTLSAADIAPRFGLSGRGSLTSWLSDREIPWRAWRRWGKRRLARTAELIHEWTGRSYTEIAEGVGLPLMTLIDHIERHVRECGWDVPEDPSKYRAFSTTTFPRGEQDA